MAETVTSLFGGHSCSPRRRRPRSWPGICSRWATMTCATRRSSSGANGSSTCWPARRRRYTSHRLRAIERLRRTGSAASRAPGSMVSWQSVSTRPIAPGNAPMIKVKHERTADCVVAGFRWHKKGAGTMIGSLLLGLYDDDHTLHHVGVAAAFRATVRKQLVLELTPLRADALEDHPWRNWPGHRKKPARRDSGGPVPPAGGTAGKT